MRKSEKVHFSGDVVLSAFELNPYEVLEVTLAQDHLSVIYQHFRRILLLPGQF